MSACLPACLFWQYWERSEDYDTPVQYTITRQRLEKK